MKDLVKTKLACHKLESQMKDVGEDEAYQFLSSIIQILDDVELVTKTVNAEEKHSSSKEDYVVTNGVIAQET